jgi:hypothetical protein
LTSQSRPDYAAFACSESLVEVAITIIIDPIAFNIGFAGWNTMRWRHIKQRVHVRRRAQVWFSRHILHHAHIEHGAHVSTNHHI